ncbi:exopolyphosphatase/guanosine-5'-triphosphate,3'-diphosphate pyrophosphatase [Azorhizobium sp. AG788]|uniref:exopolyphosphatase n=1 Tax=Azorhizobium sp. AG788 TaxID=2183897 RepID=UPI00105ECA69|nr:exopolyphosphatase [Azorhizobium sp. AG788]TDU01045.1 exopolyphosphatase/guanosine-5'-triphosphate,3'-diphosphate pyrophosphatase [Azorhizobium sp. AG788]
MAGEAPVAVIDIGSNSVRLVVYEAVTRAPVPLFNEKALCGLGRDVLSTGRLAEDAVQRAFSALRRFRGLCDAMGVGKLYALATAAARDAQNGPAFIAECEAICGVSIEILSGRREAELAAYGVISGIHDPDGVAGDLGGGSLELVDIKREVVGNGITLPIGGLALQDRSSKSLNKAEKIVRDAMRDAPVLSEVAGRTFYAVGGTWRALARLHMFQRGYPLHVMHGYRLPAKEVLDFTRIVHRAEPEALAHIEAVSSARRPLLAYGAVVLENLVRTGRPADVVISALGVREGLLYALLDAETRRHDPLLIEAQDFNILRSRSPQHGEELATWTGNFFASSPVLEESTEERRLREAACLLSDIAWRAHPDYRGEQSLNVIAHAALVGIDHPGRAFLALSVYYRHMGLGEDEYAPRLLELVTSGMLDRARILGAAMRVAYVMSAAMPGILPRVPLIADETHLKLTVPADLASLVNDRVQNRLKQLARLIGREPSIVMN